jgi:putative transposase
MGTPEEKQILPPGPERRSPHSIDYVNEPRSELELTAIRRSVIRGCPLGDESWSAKTVARLGLESTLRPRGRPKQNNIGS